MREEIIKYINNDIVSISETHLKDGDTIIDEIKWLGQSRKNNVRKYQKRVMGGIGFLIKNYLYSLYHITCIDSKYEDIF